MRVARVFVEIEYDEDIPDVKVDPLAMPQLAFGPDGLAIGTIVPLSMTRVAPRRLRLELDLSNVASEVLDV